MASVMDSDGNDFSVAWVNRLTHRVPNSEGASKLKNLCDSRNNAAIKEYFEKNQSDKNLANLFQFVVLRLTCNNDADTLRVVLDFGKSSLRAAELAVPWTEVNTNLKVPMMPWKEVEEEDEEEVPSGENMCFSRNPIMVASQQVADYSTQHI